MIRLDDRRKSRLQSPTVWFCFLSLMGVFLTVLVLFFTHGEYFSRLFYEDTMDTGMDFFHSIEYTKGRVPYSYWETLYPPLANLLFYILFRFVPEWQHQHWSEDYYVSIINRGTDINLRSWQPTMLMFIIFLLLTSALIIIMVQRYLDKADGSSIVALSALFSYGVLYGFERGNIIILSCLGTMFFVKYRNSENKILKELALLSLAFAAGLKLYPALFGILLLQDKKYKEAIRTVIYGILFFVLPIFCFKEGLAGFGIFFTKLTQHGTSRTYNPGYSFDGIVTSGVLLLCKIFHVRTDTPSVMNFLMHVLPYFNIPVMIVMLVLSCFVKKTWQKTLALCSAMMLYQSQGVYGTMFFLIPLLGFLYEEKKLNKENIVPFLALVGMIALLPIFNTPGGLFTYNSLRFQFLHVVLAFYILAVAVINIRSKRKSRR